MTRSQQQQKPDVKQEELAPFPNLPSQVSSASSLNSNASTNASTLPSSSQHEVHEGAAAQLGMTDLNRQITEPIQNTTSATMLNQNTATSSTTTTTATPSAVGGLLLSNNTINPNYNATAAALASASIVSGTVPEFLYQLTKMLTDPNNEIIEWSTYSGNGRIEVHNPSRLESEVLSRYFRHSKYSSFQRQLNYFGFRKIAGKGKMSPCSYVNDAATLDIRSLLLMKRKGSEKDKKGSTSSIAVAATTTSSSSSTSTGGGGNNRTNASSTSSSKLSGSKRVNPGNDIQPATVQPMFQQSHRNISFDTMAATVARNIADVKQQQLQHQQQLQLQRQQQQQQQQGSSNSNANSEFDVVKRTKLESSTSAPLGYTVATGKGVRHQLNGYLRSSSSGGSINNTNSTATTTNAAAASSSSQNESWLVHPSSNKASSAPAPLQFLDPNELGMSVTSTSYLNQLKNNFAAEVAASGRDDTAPDPSSSSSGVAATTAASEVTSSTESLDYPTTTDSSSGNGSTTTTSANTSSVSRVSSQSSFLGMLRRDDSLINLAMLPTLDSTASFNNHANNTSDKNKSTGGSNNGNDFGFIDYNQS
jgi:hypothetical protein